MMSGVRRTLTLDANVFLSALKADELQSKRCMGILRRVPESFLLAEPSVVYQEVCGAMARKVGLEAAHRTKEQLDSMIKPRLLSNCDREFCVSAYPLCFEFGVYAIDALYLKTALLTGSVFVSLDREDLLNKFKSKSLRDVEAYHVSDFPY